ncbi:hypothetical protein ATPR_2340 [Acetobacter tropicalis NBRC 101654]|uniref:Uncharacterized protein n=1 Tax=Acetobacter tropicalis NBRC 101654 TaxID=749388 RepID=F7VG41_9PROT|nr:hypothetical protein [Acetobacter tropicalis]GAA09336.1 hypothetical protein ATPR_2340 [Acetobacter tropicalis NBRC 101654]
MKNSASSAATFRQQPHHAGCLTDTLLFSPVSQNAFGLATAWRKAVHVRAGRYSPVGFTLHG